MATTLNDLLYQMRGRLRDMGQDVFPEVVLLDMLNNAQSELVTMLPADCLTNLMVTEGLPSVNTQTAFDLPSNFHKLVSCWKNGKQSYLSGARNAYLWLNTPDDYVAYAGERPFHWFANGQLNVFPASTIDTVANPDTAPTVALAGDGAGSVDNGVHQYAYSFVTEDGGETHLSPAASVTVADKTANGKVDVSVIAVGSGLHPEAVARKIYRTKAGGSVFYLLKTIADNTTTTYNGTGGDGGPDNAADSTLSVVAPENCSVGHVFINYIKSPEKMTKGADECALQQEYTDLLVLDGMMKALSSVQVPIGELQAQFQALFVATASKMAGSTKILPWATGGPAAK